MIVVIDGPAGAGKSSTAKEVAKRSAFRYLDSGAFYRALTVVFRQTGEDLPAFFDRLNSIRLTAQYQGDAFQVFVDGSDVTDQLRLPETAAKVSVVAAMPEARAVANAAMREFVSTGDFIGEGRDLGTAVFPQADLKIYLTADLGARAARRLAELEAMGQAPEPEDVRGNLVHRDTLDASRAADPLRKADDAVDLDTTHLTFEAQVAAVLALIDSVKQRKQPETLSHPAGDVHPTDVATHNIMSEDQNVENVDNVEETVPAVEPVIDTAAEEAAAEAEAFAEIKAAKKAEAPAAKTPSGPVDGSISGKVYTLAELNESSEDYDESTYQDLVKMYEGTLSSISEKEIIKGRVVSKDEKYVIVDIGFKSEGIVPLNEFRNADTVKPGDEVEVYLDRVEDRDGQLVLSRRKADTLRVWQNIENAHNLGTVVEGFIKRRIKGGMVVDVFGIDAFLPGSQIDVRPVRDFDAYVGKTMEFRIVKLNMTSENVVVSHRALIETDLESQREEILATMEAGQVLEGQVKNITDFGVFIDLGGVDGLLHITDLSWGRVEHPSEIIRLDQRLNVVVLEFDQDRKRISLGLKQLEPHPWDEIDKKYPEGSRVQGKVVSIADYGAFIELEKGVEGLIHISEMSWTQHIKHPSQLVEKGQVIECVVLNINKTDKKVSLGVKQLENDPWKDIAARYPSGSKHKGVVRNLTNFGVFIELEPGIDGLVHISDLSWTDKVAHPNEVVAKGDELDVVILSIDYENRRISLGHKQTLSNPWETYSVEYAPGTKLENGVVAKATDKGVFIKLPLGAEAFLPAKEALFGDAVVANYKDGQVVNVTVIEFDETNKSIIVSEKAYLEGDDRKVKKAKPKKGEPAEGAPTLGEMSGLADLKAKLLEQEKNAKG
jgi:small subunit ribosomal protein S1